MIITKLNLKIKANVNFYFMQKFNISGNELINFHFSE